MSAFSDDYSESFQSSVSSIAEVIEEQDVPRPISEANKSAVTVEDYNTSVENDHHLASPPVRDASHEPLGFVNNVLPDPAHPPLDPALLTSYLRNSAFPVPSKNAVSESVSGINSFGHRQRLEDANLSVKELVEKKQRARVRRAHHLEELETYKELVQQLQGKLLTAEERKRTDILRLSTALSKKECQVVELTHVSREKESQIVSFRREVETCYTTMKDLNSKLMKRGEEVKQLQQEIADTQEANFQKLKAVQQNHSEEVNAVQEQLRTTQRRFMEEFEMVRQRAMKEADKVKVDLNGKKLYLASKIREVKAESKHLDALKAQLMSCVQYNQLQQYDPLGRPAMNRCNSFPESSPPYLALQQEKERLRQKGDQLEEALRTSKCRADTQAAELSAIEKREARLKSDLQQLETHHFRSKKEKMELEKRVLQVEAEAGSSRAALETLQVQNDTLVEDHHHLKQRFEKLENRIILKEIQLLKEEKKLRVRFEECHAKEHLIEDFQGRLALEQQGLEHSKKSIRNMVETLTTVMEATTTRASSDA